MSWLVEAIYHHKNSVLSLEVGRPSMKSMMMSSHTWHGMGNGYKSPTWERVSTLALWQTSQEETYSCTTLCMEGQ